MRRLGSLPCALLTPASMREELIRIRAQTDKHTTSTSSATRRLSQTTARDAAWRAVLAPYYRELGLEDGATRTDVARAPFGEAAAEVLDEFKPAVVSFHFGLPSAGLLARVRSWGARILSSATTVDEARWLESHGADAIVAQGSKPAGIAGCSSRTT